MSNSRELHATLPHPIIDTDGHMAEHFPYLAPYLEGEGLDLNHPAFKRMLPPYGGTDRSWHEQTPEERAVSRTPRGPWWSSPAANSLDLATALIPELLYDRLDETGIDYSVIYPSLGLVFLHTPDERYRVGSCRALNRANAELFAQLSDRLCPVAAIPMNTPEEAIAEMTYAVNTLGFKSVLCAGYVQRPFEALSDADPELSRYAFWLDQFGLDSLYDYDPVWETARNLGVSLAFHSGFIGMTPYRSPSSYVANHLSMLAVGQQCLATSLLLGGVPHRFPELNFAFLEGGVAWAANPYSDLVGHYEKRNVAALRENLDPATIDGALIAEMLDKYNMPLTTPINPFSNRPQEPESMIDEWERSGITSVEDIKRLFVDRFFFGAEADDPMTSLAFNTKVNPLGARLNAILGSDIAHWDLPDITEVLEEAWEMVEHEWIDEADFERFTFENPVKFYTHTNKNFFDGTVVEPEVTKYLEGES